jgi:hypothetical protein
MRSETRDRVRRRGALLALPLAALLALTACGSSDGASQHESAAQKVVDEDGGGGSTDRDGDDGAAAQDEAGGEDPTVSDGWEDTSRLTRTHLIRRAELTMLTDDVPGQYSKAVRIVEAAGGYVSSESTQQDSEVYQHSSLSLQVPP